MKKKCLNFNKNFSNDKADPLQSEYGQSNHRKLSEMLGFAFESAKKLNSTADT